MVTLTPDRAQRVLATLVITFFLHLSCQLKPQKYYKKSLQLWKNLYRFAPASIPSQQVLIPDQA